MLNINVPARVYFGSPLRITEKSAGNFADLLPSDEPRAGMSHKSDEFVETKIQPYLKKGGLQATLNQAKEFTAGMIKYYRSYFKCKSDRDYKVDLQKLRVIDNDAARNSVYDLRAPISPSNNSSASELHKNTQSELADTKPRKHWKNSIHSKIWDNRMEALSLINQGLKSKEIAKILKVYPGLKDITDQNIRDFKSRYLIEKSPAQYILKQIDTDLYSDKSQSKLLDHADSIIGLINLGVSSNEIEKILEDDPELKGITGYNIRDFKRRFLKETSPAQYVLK